MKKEILISIVLAFSGCATRGALEREAKERRSLQSDLTMRVIDCKAIILNSVNMLENRIDAIEGEIRGPWDREECEYYKPEAQKLFCHRKPRFAPFADGER